MKDIYISSGNILTPLGFTSDENASAMIAGKTGIRHVGDLMLAPSPFYASLIGSEQLAEKFSAFDDPARFTRFEQMAICSMKDAIASSASDLTGKDTIFVLSTTKGNIDLLRSEPQSNKLYLWNTARLLRDYFHFANEPLVVSDACISGIQAILTAARLISAGFYKKAVINGTDVISEFVLSGFSSFKSLSTGPCRPFDKTRDGLSLGEGSGTLILSDEPPAGNIVNIVAGDGFSTNDANHISGPSRTGEGLFIAIEKTLKKSGKSVDFISAHGTATSYNDEMESIALTRAGLHNVPVNSFKGYWGHTLGAAGVIESVMSIWSLTHGILFGTQGFSVSGITHPLNIIGTATKKEISCCLKIASGFGGCNAAMLFYRK